MSEQNQRRPAPRRKKRKNGAVSALIYVAIVIGVSAILAGVGWVLANDLLALNKEPSTVVITLENELFTEKTRTEDGKTVTYEVANLGRVASILKENGLIEFPFAFNFFCAISDSDEKITAGVYELDTEMDYQALVRNMSSKSSTRQSVLVTIPEGYELDQIFQLLEEKGVCTREELYDTSANYDFKFSFLQDTIPLGDNNRLEGYLFPDTYEFYYGDSPVQAINKMLLNFDAKFTEALRDKARENDMTMHDIVIIAAMIERETDGEDHEKIASVIYNRLQANMRLQIDATVQYALPERKENLSIADTEIDSPYNTYRVDGLPAGPIASPGIDSLLAAITPESTNYYYYKVGTEGETHVFFRDYDSFIAYG